MAYTQDGSFPPLHLPSEEPLSSPSSLQPSPLDPSVLSSCSSCFPVSSQPSLPSVSSASNVFLSSDDARFLVGRIQALEAKYEAIVAELRQQRVFLERIADKRGWEADDEDEEPVRQAKKKKKKKDSGRKLTACNNLSELTAEQRKVRSELLAHLDRQMKKLAGVPDNENALPDEAEPGESNGTIVPDFKKEVGDPINERLINQTAYLVFRQQTNPEHRELTHEDIEFTAKDVGELAKEVFRSWKRQESVKDPEKRKKREESTKRSTRRQRKRQRKIDRGKAAESYGLTYDVDVSPLLQTDWMSDYISDRSDLDEAGKKEYQTRKLVKAGYSLDAAETEIWEIVRPGFRSNAVNQVYAELDSFFADSQKKSRKKKQTVKRVFLGRFDNDIPELPPYPFMVDEAWTKVFVEAKGRGDQFVMLSEDPEGFGTKKK